MNFSHVPFKSFIGTAIRFPLRLLPKSMVISVVQGPLVGKRWIVGSANHGCWLGSYEYKKHRVFASELQLGQNVFDLGANVGYYSLTASAIVGDKGKVFSFEPLPRNLLFLRKHVEINKCKNIDILMMAISDRNGIASFDDTHNSSMCKLADSSSFKVSTVTLDFLYEQHIIKQPHVIKMDIEGAEYRALCGATNLLTTCRPTIFLSTHGKEVHKECCEFLTHLGYKLQPLSEDGENLSLQDSREVIARK